MYSKEESIKEQLKVNSVVTVANKAPDKQGRCVLAVILKNIDSEAKQSCFWQMQYFRYYRSSTSSQPVVDTLKEYGIVSIVNSPLLDPACYMTACFNLLKVNLALPMLVA